MPARHTTAPPEGCVWIEEAARRCAVQPGTLRKWRWLNKGPEAFSVGGRLAYPEDGIEAHLTGLRENDIVTQRAKQLARKPRPHVRTAA